MKTILVVDDEYDLQQTICATLEIEGYRPVPAGNGREALGLLESETPDLVLTDVMMPHMTGYALVDAIRRRPDGKTLPVLIMSSIDPALHPRGDWNGVLAKPFTYERLIESIEGLLKD
jgi:CheY-like chemotaxis protein